jgi:hypothetical protein
MALPQTNLDAGPMSTQDIIRTEFEHNGAGMDWKQVYLNLIELTKQPKYRILRSGNSLLVVRNDGNGDAYVLMASADKPLDMIKHITEFFTALQKAHYRKVSFDTPRPAITRLVKATGFKFTATSSPTPDPTTGRTSIHIEVEL